MAIVFNRNVLLDPKDGFIHVHVYLVEASQDIFSVGALEDEFKHVEYAVFLLSFAKGFDLFLAYLPIAEAFQVIYRSPYVPAGSPCNHLGIVFGYSDLL